MINILYWNVRGIRNDRSRHKLRKLKRLHKFSFVAVAKPKIPLDNLNELAGYLGFNRCCVNLDNNLWLFWEDVFSCDIIMNSGQPITLKIMHNQVSTPIFVTLVYAKCRRRDCSNLWEELMEMN
ncbi:Endonuclease/exonuclease/phosphatase [Quillaja saponaria]|uniref:Endonuclease/exonuclease/phosphatase n=1 Tax=Quillaja saponaria TaxID=32244 RepID=A0AAD7L345_QUISA|nr:Endonuclease/exonuclease/phosphatase [Quillaja saponaria]